MEFTTVDTKYKTLEPFTIKSALEAVLSHVYIVLCHITPTQNYLPEARPLNWSYAICTTSVTTFIVVSSWLHNLSWYEATIQRLPVPQLML